MYKGTAVIDRNNVPIRNELMSQSTRWNGNRENMILAGYLADGFPDRLSISGAFREL